MAGLGDDLGTQRALMFSPALFRRYLKPRYARLISLYKEHSVLVHLHSCGNVLAIVGDLLERRSSSQHW